MYKGLREQLIRNKTFRKGKLIDILGQKELMESVEKRLNAFEDHIFIYGESPDFEERQPINLNTFENCYFDFGQIHPSKGSIYFSISRYLHDSVPIEHLFDIIPIKSIKKGTNFELKDLKLYDFWGKGLNHTKTIHYNPVEAFLSVQGNFNKGIRNCQLRSVASIKPGISFESKDPFEGRDSFDD